MTTSRRDQAAAASYANAGTIRVYSTYKQASFAPSFLDSLSFGKVLFIGLGILAVVLFALL